VSHPDGEAKFWLSPTVELARKIGLSSQRIKEAERLVETRHQEIIDAWNIHFGGWGYERIWTLCLGVYRR
jgi:hypothetical protein